MNLDWNRITRIVQHDPARRGLATFCRTVTPLDHGALEAAANGLARPAASVGIVTGFCVADADPPAAETDGPPGAVFLAKAIVALGGRATLISDAYGMPLIEACCRAAGLGAATLLECPFEDGAPTSAARMSNADEHCARTDAWIDEVLIGPGRDWTHLVAIERVGPSHTSASLAAQSRDGPAPMAAFETEAPADSRDVSHNMRGLPIQGYTAKLHRLFDAVRLRRLPIISIGIGDGGNEIGMGSFPWETLRLALSEPRHARIISRVATDHMLVAGVSNWGAYALALCMLAAAHRLDLAAEWNAAAEARLIERMVSDAGAIDGVTRRREPSVDGLAMDDYLAVLVELRRALGLDS